jgi:DNA gyrase subunit B
MPDKIKPTSAFVEDTYEYRENEFAQVRGSLGVYVGRGEAAGALHLLNEIVANSIDECTNPNSPGDTIWVTFFEKECKFIIEDNGRGIPLDILYGVISKKHYSTKFHREFNKYSGGQNGVGTTITAALSDHYVITSRRNGESRTLHLSGDGLVDEGLKKCSENKHGTYTEFIPSQKWLGKFTLTVDDIDDYLRRLSYVMPEGIKIKYLSINKKKKEVAKTIKRLGISADVEYLGQNLEFTPIEIVVPEVTIETENGDSEYFRMRFAFSYDRTVDDTIVDSYCNYLHTKEGGTHEQAALQTVSAFFARQAKNLDPNAKYEVTADDCRKGLILVVNCEHSNPKFEGQHKSKVDQKDIIQYGKKPALDALGKYFETNNSLLRRIIQYLRQIAKIRQEAHKIKAVALKKPTTFIDDADMKVFKNISDRNYTGYKELILSEGVSAIAAVDSARNVKCQGMFAITGVVANTYGMPLERVMQIPTYALLVKVLGCDIGPKFDINKLRWNAICCCCDSDVDGKFITSLLCVFFATHMPEIVKRGLLYRIEGPLYRIGEKAAKKYNGDIDYIFDKKDYYKIFHKIVAENLKVAVVLPKTKAQMVKGTGEMNELSKKELMKLMHLTVEYLPELRTLEKRSACPANILEYICYFMEATRNAKDPMGEFEDLLQKKFPELHYDSQYESIMGAVDGINITLIIDGIFQNMAKRFMQMIRNLPAFYLLVKNRNAKDSDSKADDWDLMTFGQFMEMADKSFNVPIEQRYKGLGESDASMIFPSMMNPKTRKMVRITMEDAEEARKTIELLHGDSEAMREARRKLLYNANITLEDIDN